MTKIVLGWTADKQYNVMHIKYAERYLIDLLRYRGWISLNEVYGSLGMPRVLEAQTIGWKILGIWDRNNYIKFEFDETDNNPNIVIKFKNMVTLL
jgi:hypothetical protein